MSSWHHHLLCVLQSFNFIVLFLDLELQCLPLVGKGQPLLPEKKYVWHDRNSHISKEIALIFFYKNRTHMREKDFFVSLPQHVNSTCVLLYVLSIILVYLWRILVYYDDGNTWACREYLCTSSWSSLPPSTLNWSCGSRSRGT